MTPDQERLLVVTTKTLLGHLERSHEQSDVTAAAQFRRALEAFETRVAAPDSPPSTMSTDRFRDCLTALDWTQRGLARLLGRQEGTVRQWARGALPIPGNVSAWLEVRGRHAEATPPPIFIGRRNRDTKPDGTEDEEGA